MEILDSILSAGSGKAASELIKNFGMSEDDATQAIGQLAP